MCSTARTLLIMCRSKDTLEHASCRKSGKGDAVEFRLNSSYESSERGACCFRVWTDYLWNRCCGGSLGRRRLTSEGGRTNVPRSGGVRFRNCIRWLPGWGGTVAFDL